MDLRVSPGPRVRFILGAHRLIPGAPRHAGACHRHSRLAAAPQARRGGRGRAPTRRCRNDGGSITLAPAIRQDQRWHALGASSGPPASQQGFNTEEAGRTTEDTEENGFWRFARYADRHRRDIVTVRCRSTHRAQRHIDFLGVLCGPPGFLCVKILLAWPGSLASLTSIKYSRPTPQRYTCATPPPVGAPA